MYRQCIHQGLLFASFLLKNLFFTMSCDVRKKTNELLEHFTSVLRTLTCRCRLPRWNFCSCTCNSVTTMQRQSHNSGITPQRFLGPYPPLFVESTSRRTRRIERQIRTNLQRFSADRHSNLNREPWHESSVRTATHGDHCRHRTQRTMLPHHSIWAAFAREAQNESTL